MGYDIQKRTFLERKFSQLKSVTAVQRAFRSRYKTRNAPTANTIKDIAKKFESTGSVHDMARKGKGETEFRKTVRKQVQALIESDCQLSQRCAPKYRCITFNCVQGPKKGPWTEAISFQGAPEAPGS